ncbi:phosphate ABC transporter permease PstA [Aerophototrophica crusticola]|uniref:Phosphate transport system permease protein PstA n=1 Tax=Aerophototrophica crusticola TaxID=1709002 RepID=A0A858R9N1_9PROT|nr:phosphate ABC transporter permease PstA [Rhodospirillaceae bacterium B3]
MTEITAPLSDRSVSFHTSDAAEKRLRARYAAEKRFKAYGVIAIAFAVSMLAILLFTLFRTGISAFWQTEMQLEVTFDAAVVDPKGTGNPADWDRGAFQGLANEALYKAFPEVTGRTDRRELRGLLSPVAGAFLVNYALENPAVVGQTVKVWLPTSDGINQIAKGNIDRTLPESNRPVNDTQLGYLDRMESQGAIRTAFNSTFFSASDSNYPELAGILGATVGTLLTMVVTILLSLPISVAAAVYLEEFAPKNRLTELIEVNINNLAAVPSIVFGLLGLAMFLNFFGMPRSSPLVGGMVLALLVLPTIIIASRAALKAVPPSIREAALGMGASKLQTVMHHVLPLAMPGIMTGTIIAMAHALGETAPLLMIGMNAFVTAPPTGFLDSSSALPVQVYIWADKPERGFVELTSAAILVLLTFLVAMNATAIYFRKKFERRW